MVWITLIVAVWAFLIETCVAEENSDKKVLAAHEFFAELCTGNRVWTGTLILGEEEVTVGRLAITVKRPCDICEVRALHLDFDFEGSYEFPQELRTSDGGFWSRVSPTSLAILYGFQCVGLDLPPKYAELRFVGCERRQASKDEVEYRCQIVGPVPPEQAYKATAQLTVPKMTCIFTVTPRRVEGVIHQEQEVRFRLSLLELDEKDKRE